MKPVWVFFALGVLFAAHAYADDWLMITGLSKHSISGYCEANPGAGYRHDFNSDWSIVAFRYRNSLCQMSNAVGVCYQPLHIGRFSAGVCPSVITGYSDHAEFLPVPSASFNLTRDTALDFIGATDGQKSVVGVGVRIRF